MAAVRAFLLVAISLVGLVQCQFDGFGRDRDRNRERDRDRGRDQTAEGCFGKVMDIFFILDSSSSIYINDYRQQHQFVREVVSRFDVSPRTTRVGILTFSDDYERPPLGLNRAQSKGDVLASIDETNLPYRTGITNTDRAIRYVRENNEFRRDITKVMVILTDGGSRSPGATSREAELARNQGFYMFVVGVGQYLDEREWRAIASDPDDNFIFNITNFRYLDSLKFVMPPRACTLPPIIAGGTSCTVSEPADVFFVAGPGGSQDAMFLIDHFVERTRDPFGLVRVSFIIDSCTDGENVELTDPGRFCDRFADLGAATSETYVDLITRMRSLAAQTRNSRVANQVAVMFIDNESMRLNRFGIVNEIERAKADRINLIVVDLGVRQFGSTIAGLPDRPEDLIRFQGGSIAGQRQSQERMIDRTCRAINAIGTVNPSK